MDIKRSGSRPSGKGPDEYFTGNVRIDPLFEAPDPARARGASVTFEPGARSAWHTHPLGQTLIVTSGCGWVQSEGRSKNGNTTGRRGLVPAEGEALAWCHADHGHDPYRHSGTARRQSRRVDGKGQRRTIRGGPARRKREVNHYARNCNVQRRRRSYRERSRRPRRRSRRGVRCRILILCVLHHDC